MGQICMAPVMNICAELPKISTIHDEQKVARLQVSLAQGVDLGESG